MDIPFWIATTIFFVSYALIVSEKLHKTVVALFAAALMLVLQDRRAARSVSCRRTGRGLERDHPADLDDGYHQSDETDGCIRIYCDQVGESGEGESRSGSW